MTIPIPNCSRKKEVPKVLAIIPARGGSKGLPGKNIRDLFGKPLIAYSIEVALKSKLVNRVIVSTDDEKIAEISKSFGAQVPFLRPGELAQDNSNLSDGVNYTVEKLRRTRYSPDILLILFPTHPFRTPGLVDFLAGKLVEGRVSVDTVKMVTHDSLTLFSRNKADYLEPLLNPQNSMNDAAPKKYFRQYGLLHGSNLAHSNKGPYHRLITNPISLIDIDTLTDFLLAEEVIKQGLFDFELE